MSAGILGGGWGKNIQTYLFKYCRGWTYLASASGEPLLIFFLVGWGWAGFFLGWVDGRIYKHTFVYIWVGGEHIWPAPLGNSAHFFFFFSCLLSFLRGLDQDKSLSWKIYLKPVECGVTIQIQCLTHRHSNGIWAWLEKMSLWFLTRLYSNWPTQPHKI